MKIKIGLLALILSLLAPQGFSQFYYKTYGDLSDVPLQCGTNTPLITGIPILSGHAMAGSEGARLHVVRTNNAGIPFFNQYYTITGPTGGIVKITSVQITEANSTTLVLIGSFSDAGNEGLFFLSLNPAGGLITLRTYLWTSGVVTNLRVNGMFNAGGTRFFVAGKTQVLVGGINTVIPIAASFSLAGASNWGFMYYPGLGGIQMEGADIEFFTGGGVSQLYMVGSFRGPALTDGFVFSIDPSLGGPTSLVSLYGTFNTNESFSGVTTCNSTTLGGVTGLMISGTSNARPTVPANLDIWGIKIDPAFNVLGSQLYDYSHFPNRDNFANDVVERRRAPGIFTYFFTGTVKGGFFGLNDINVVKTNDLLVSTLPFGNFTYGTSALNESGEMATVKSLTGINGGLIVFGTAATSPLNRDFIMEKSYFSGHNTCNSRVDLPNTNPGPGLLNTFQIGQINSLVGIVSTLTILPTLPNFTYCFSPSLPAWTGASNLKTTDDEEIDEFAELAFDIHAISGVNNLSAITLSPTESVNATVEVVNLLGETLFHSEMKLGEGNNTLPNTGDLATGILVVRVITENGVVFSQKVLIQ
jgi:hypothetical protein